MSTWAPVLNEVNSVKINPACERLPKRFQFLSRFAISLMSLLLPALAAGQASFVQVK